MGNSVGYWDELRGNHGCQHVDFSSSSINRCAAQFTGVVKHPPSLSTKVNPIETLWKERQERHISILLKKTVFTVQCNSHYVADLRMCT